MRKCASSVDTLGQSSHCKIQISIAYLDISTDAINGKAALHMLNNTFKSLLSLKSLKSY